MHQEKKVRVIGGGLAGCEAAWQIAQRGVEVDLYEMRPIRPTEAHTTDHLSELVCSNSFGSDSLLTASRILKDELATLGSLTLEVARKNAVPAGASLAVDRTEFAKEISQRISQHPKIRLHRKEATEIFEDEISVLATGPLTSSAMSGVLSQILGSESLYFYDAISPIVSADSLDLSQIFSANRYGKGETADFLNIPLNKEQYDQFIFDITHGEVVLPHDFEEEKYFEGCMPIEAIASRGHQTLAFGPMKPVGLVNPKTGKIPYAVIQLRAENKYKTAYNLVGFQTKLRYREQERIFRTLPGLQHAEFLRLGSMHRNTYINSPEHLFPTLQLRKRLNIFVAGQLTGTEGYLESSAGGLIAGINAAKLAVGDQPRSLPVTTLLGALLDFITDPQRKNFQPCNVNMGLFPPLEVKFKSDKKQKYQMYAERSYRDLTTCLNSGYLGGL